MSDDTAMICGEVRYLSGTLEPAEERLWEEYHAGYADMIALDRADLTKVAPHMVPANLEKRIKYVPVSRDDVWKLLTGKPRVKNSWNK